MKDTETGETVALKKMICAKEGILQIKHEINILRMLQHENIVQMKEIVFSPGPEMDEQGNPDGCQCSEGSLYMVLEYMEHDLWGLIKNKEVKFTPPYIKCYMRQLLTGLHYLHVNKVLHHDIKGTNILLDNEGNLKIADFGLARALPSDPNEALTNKVVTLRYRPPELLLGSCNYGPAVDIWSAGCVFVELLQRKEFLSGNDEQDLLNEIYWMFGGADEVNWPGVSKLPLHKELMPKTESCLKETLINIDQHAIKLLERMLTLDPSQRISAKDALEHDYFYVDPLPCDRKSLPKCESSLHFLLSKRLGEEQAMEIHSTPWAR